MIIKTLCIAGLLSFGMAGWAADDVPPAVEQGLQKLEKLSPGLQTEQVSRGPVDGLYEFIADGRVMYVTEDGRYLVSGQIIDLDKKLNLTQVKQAEIDVVLREKQGKLALQLFDELGEDNMIVFGDDKAEHTVTVFTDVECPYCVKFHNDVPKLNAAGIKVRYLLYPRAGIGSRSYNTSVSVWCAEDRNTMLGVAKNRQPVPEADCDNPVKDHHAIGDKIGLRGTPMLVLDSGLVLPGYVPPEQLLAAFRQ